MVTHTHDLPFISCIMPTYGRPDYVNESVKMFMDQDYPKDRRELIILNDCSGQFFTTEISPEHNIKIINKKYRYENLGQKRNATIDLAKGDLIAIWDDDDIYLPWRLSYCQKQMGTHQTSFYRSSEFWAYWGKDSLEVDTSRLDWVCHTNTLFTKNLYKQVDGYPEIDLGEDRVFFEKVHRVLNSDFIKYPIKEEDRFSILRGYSKYNHMCMAGGKNELDLTEGIYDIIPIPIEDIKLRNQHNQLISRGVSNY